MKTSGMKLMLSTLLISLAPSMTLYLLIGDENLLNKEFSIGLRAGLYAAAVSFTLLMFLIMIRFNFVELDAMSVLMSISIGIGLLIVLPNISLIWKVASVFGTTIILMLILSMFGAHLMSKSIRASEYLEATKADKAKSQEIWGKKDKKDIKDFVEF